MPTRFLRGPPTAVWPAVAGFCECVTGARPPQQLPAAAGAAHADSCHQGRRRSAPRCRTILDSARAVDGGSQRKARIAATGRGDRC